MSRHASQNAGVVVSPNSATAMAAPMNGAVAKYAPVRAAPKPRKAKTNITRLMP